MGSAIKAINFAIGGSATGAVVERITGWSYRVVTLEGCLPSAVHQLFPVPSLIQ